MTEELTTHRQSGLLMYARCPAQYKRRFVDGQIRPPFARMLRGTGVHAGAHFNFRQKVDSHEDLKAKDIIDYSIAVYDNKYSEEGIILAPKEKTIGKNKVLGQERDRCWRLSELQAEKFAPTVQPIAVEKSIEADFPEHGFKVRGTLDLKDDKNIITDVKAGTKKRTVRDVHKDFQLSMYYALDMIFTGTSADGVRLAVLVDKKSPEVQLLESFRTDEDFVAWFKTVVEFDKAIKAGVFPPCNKAEWWCSPDWCGYWVDCEFWSDSERARFLAE